jgi:L,D-transpeptidase catalytic domain
MRTGLVLPASLIAAALTVSLALPAHANIVVNIDKNAQQMTVSVDGQQRYVWPVSTGRRGYDTPNGTFKVNRMDADHLSQEWDNAPMPHTMFFDMRGHAIHGFSDVKHLGLPVSHGCVRLAPDHAATLFDLVKAEGMSETTVVVSGETPAGAAPYVARRGPVDDNAGQPMDIAPGYGQPAGSYYAQQPGYGQQQYYRQAQQPYYAQAQRPYYDQAQQPYYGQAQPSYRAAQQPYYGQQQPSYRDYGQQQPSYREQSYGQPAYGQPQYNQY